jgi:hypothetical protein
MDALIHGEGLIPATQRVLLFERSKDLQGDREQEVRRAFSPSGQLRFVRYTTAPLRPQSYFWLFLSLQLALCVHHDIVRGSRFADEASTLLRRLAVLMILLPHEAQTSPNEPGMNDSYAEGVCMAASRWISDYH